VKDRVREIKPWWRQWLESGRYERGTEDFMGLAGSLEEIVTEDGDFIGVGGADCFSGRSLAEHIGEIFDGGSEFDVVRQTMDHDMRGQMKIELVFSLDFIGGLGKGIGGIDAGEDGEVSVMSRGGPNSPGEFSLGSSFGTILLFIKVAGDFTAGNRERMGIEIISTAKKTMPSTDELVGSPGDKMIDCDFYLRNKESTMFQGVRDGYRG
jgi:hypothetical protein